MAQSRAERLRKQRERQREYRARRRQSRKPTRDDIARAMLHFAVTENVKLGREDKLDDLWDEVSKVLVRQGFDRKQTDEAFDELVERYKRGWDFQRRFPEDGFPDDDEDAGA